VLVGERQADGRVKAQGVLSRHRSRG
jgi:hypothetical protein